MVTPFTPIAEFEPAVRALFERAGWYPGRQNEEFIDKDYPPAIQAVEREIGELEVGNYSTIHFSRRQHMEDVSGFSELLERTLYPIGYSTDYWDLCVDEHGSVYLAGDWLILLGMTFREGIENYFRLGGLDCPALNEDDMTWGGDREIITWPPLLPPATP